MSMDLRSRVCPQLILGIALGGVVWKGYNRRHILLVEQFHLPQFERKYKRS